MEIARLPNGLRSDLYEYRSAQADGKPTKDQIRLMVRVAPARIASSLTTHGTKYVEASASRHSLSPKSGHLKFIRPRRGKLLVAESG